MVSIQDDRGFTSAGYVTRVKMAHELSEKGG